MVLSKPDQLILDVHANRSVDHRLIQASHQDARVHFVSNRLPAGPPTNHTRERLGAKALAARAYVSTALPNHEPLNRPTAPRA